MGTELIITPTIIDLALAEVANGVSLAAIAKSLGVKRQTLSAAIHSNTDLEERYESARRQAADAMAEEIIEIADSEGDANKAKVRCDARKWLASKYLPARYGEKLDLNVNAPAPIAAALAEAKARTKWRDKENVVDAEIIEHKIEQPASSLPSVPCGTQAVGSSLRRNEASGQKGAAPQNFDDLL